LGNTVENTRMKRFFFFSLSTAILCACGMGGFFLWKNHQTQKEKRARLDKYYYEQFEARFPISAEILSLSKSTEELIECLEYQAKSTQEIVAEMIQDGYDRAEINEITSKAYKNSGAAEKLKLNFLKTE